MLAFRLMFPRDWPNKAFAYKHTKYIPIFLSNVNHLFTTVKRKLNFPDSREITKQEYDKKLQVITDRILMLTLEIEEHSQADHDYKTTVATVLSVARRANKIFESAELQEKRQFINFLVQNHNSRIVNWSLS